MKQENNIKFFSSAAFRFIRQKPFLDDFYVKVIVVVFTFALSFATTRWHISASNDFIE